MTGMGRFVPLVLLAAALAACAEAETRGICSAPPSPAGCCR